MTLAPTSSPADLYESFLVPRLFRPLATTFLDIVQPPSGARVLDVACGTGIVAREVARRVGPGGQVVGLDPSPAMLATARNAAEQAGVLVEWREGRAESLPFAAGKFDCVFCQQGLQFVPDKTIAIAEMARVLAPGGMLALTVWQGIDQHPFFVAFGDAVEQNLGSPAMRAPFAFGSREALSSLLSGVGLEQLELRTVDVTVTFPTPGQYIALNITAASAAIPSLQSLDDRNRAEAIAAVEAAMAPVLKEHTTPDGHLNFVMHANMVRGKVTAS